MNSQTDAVARVADDLAGTLRCAEIRGFDDEALLSATGAVEALGRRVDALRAALAGEVADRSRRMLGPEGLAARKGCRSARELLERVTLVSGATAARRMRVGSDTQGRSSIGGVWFPARFPAVADALDAGTLGVDAAEVIVRELGRIIDRVPADALQVAEQSLVAAATGTVPPGAETESGTTDTVDPAEEDVRRTVPVSADEVRLQASVWVAFLDPDGVEPAEEHAMARRGFRLGAARDGLVPVSGALMPEVAGGLQRLLDAALNPKAGPSFLDPAGVGEPERRSFDQRRHDSLAGIIARVARDPEAPTIGGAAPTVLVTVTKENLDAGTGAGWVEGVETPVSMRTVRQLACTGGTQTVSLTPDGRVIGLGSEQRCFTTQQRRAITLRDGECIIPGCHIPASWCEIHHVIEAAKGGATHEGVRSFV